jgi:hypothetical protein
VQSTGSPMTACSSITATSKPAAASLSADVHPAGPAPMTRTSWDALMRGGPSVRSAMWPAVPPPWLTQTANEGAQESPEPSRTTAPCSTRTQRLSNGSCS